MSNSPYSPCPTLYRPAPSNGLGIAGFVVSLVGLISCGFVSPIGVLLSAIAIFKRPRGFAFAGLVVGVFGCIAWMIALLGGLLTGLAGLVGLGAVLPFARAEMEMSRIAHVVVANRAADGTITSDLSTLPRLTHDELIDPWGHPYRITVKGPDWFEIDSDGPDGIAGTRDDLRFEESHGKPAKHRHLSHRSMDNVD